MNESTERLADLLIQLNDLVAEQMNVTLRQDPFAQQKMYEKWIRLDEWRLRDQGLPLALGVDPVQWASLLEMTEIKDLVDKTWQAFSELSMSVSGMGVINTDNHSDEWNVSPGVFYRWLVAQGITVPDALDALMQFVMTVVKKPDSLIDNATLYDQAATAPGSRSSDREKVLGAAFNIVSKEPDACRHESGLTDGRALAEMIAAQSIRWFDSPTPPLSVARMGDLLEKWLE